MLDGLLMDWTTDVVGETEIHSDCRLLIEHCRQRSPLGWPMQKQAFCPTEVPLAILPKLLMMDVQGDEFQFRLYGTHLVVKYGRELTGRYLRDAVTGEPVEFVYGVYRRAVHDRVPILTRTAFSTRHGAIQYDRAIVPMTDDRGDVRYLLAIITLLGGPGAKTVLQALGHQS